MLHPSLRVVLMPSRSWKAFFDTNVIDWLLEPENFRVIQTATTSGQLIALAGPEVAHEVRRTPDSAKRAALEEVLAVVFPLVPTRLPRSGMARSGLAIASGPATEALHRTLASIPGVDRLDPVHLLNARAEKCDLFVTHDKRLLNHRGQLEPLLGCLLITPEDLLARLMAGA